jgi:tRNA dimethylallyltransferase
MTPAPLKPLLVVAGPTASGKSTLAVALAERCNGEIVSCDSVAVYRGMEIGTAKPTPAERARVPHHCLDLYAPDEPCTAGDYARAARTAIAGIAARGKLPIVAGGTGLYLRALIEGLAPAPPRDEALRTRLRERAEVRGSAYLHRLLARLDADAAARIHANDTPKLVRAIEVTLAALYARINSRAQAMFEHGLLEETATLRRQFGDTCRALTSLGYAEAMAVLRGELTRSQAIAQAQQGHRNYAKRQLTWFRRDTAIQWLEGFGDEAWVLESAESKVQELLRAQTET